MKSLDGGSIKRVAIGLHAPNPGCQPRQGYKSKVAKSGATDCLLVGSVREHPLEARSPELIGERISKEPRV
jgi:hypothetical protein